MSQLALVSLADGTHAQIQFVDIGERMKEFPTRAQEEIIGLYLKRISQ
jgi:hypothetical protein